MRFFTKQIPTAIRDMRMAVSLDHTSAVRKPWPVGQIWSAAHFRVARMAVSIKNNQHKFPRLSMRDPDEFHLC